MAVTTRLDLRQSQTLVMTPQLQQAIKLLQLSNLELTDYVERELEQNPLLQRADGEGGAEADDGADDAGGSDEAAIGDSAVRSEAETLPREQDAPLDTDYENDWDGEATDTAAWSGPSTSGGRKAGDFDTADPNLEQTLSSQSNLRDHLVGQINVDLIDPRDRLIGMLLIDQLDDAGYLKADLDAVAASLGCPRTQVDAVVERLQRFEPSGIFARSLAECWAIQLRERDRLDPAMQALLDNLDLLERRDVAALVKVCGVDEDDLRDMVAEIRALDPKPASAFDHEVAQTVIPDIVMRPAPNGGWIIELNADTLPQVLVNRRYYTELNGRMRSRADKQYLAECLQTASWLVKSLHQRATTILRVAREIVRQQEGFFLHGVAHLRPLILRDIATAIDMHESTVSRVTANKYIATPRGVFELKYFFTPAISGAEQGTVHSSESVRHRIRTLIDGEDAREVLSDDKLVELLHAEGIDVARRTVAKYREAMHIPSSVQRRRQKRSAL